MEQNFGNNENSMDGKLSKEKNLLQSNSSEVLGLMKENKEPLTEKAKMLFSKIGKISSVLVAGVGIAGVVAATGSAGYEIATHTHNNMLEMSDGMKTLIMGDLDKTAFVTLIGVLGALGFDKLIEKLRMKKNNQ